MTTFKRFLIFLYTVLTLRFLRRGVSLIKRDLRYRSFSPVGKIVALSTFTTTTILFWPVVVPVRWMLRRRAERQVLDFIDAQIAANEAWDIDWPSEWNDGLTPEQEDYWDGYFGEAEPQDDAWATALNEFLATDCGEDDCPVHERLREENRPLTIDEAISLANRIVSDDDEPIVLLLTYVVDEPSEAGVYDQAREDEKSPLYQGVTILGSHR